jgi:hypothetical protein
MKLQFVPCLKGVFTLEVVLAKSTLTGVNPSPDDCLHGPTREATRSIKTEIADPEESAV